MSNTPSPKYMPDNRQQTCNFPRPRGRPKRHKKGPNAVGPKKVLEITNVLTTQLEFPLGDRPND